MATVQVDGDGMRIKLDHAETEELLAKLGVVVGGDAGAVVAVLIKFGVAAAAAGFVAAALALHILWEAFAIKMSDKGNGVVLFAPTILWTGIAPGVVIPSTRHPVDIKQDWATTGSGTFKSETGDVVEFSVAGGGDPAAAQFRLDNATGWNKAFVMMDGEGNRWWIQADPNQRGESALWTHQLQNGQRIPFWKPQFLGQWGESFSIGGLEKLQGGAVVTFTWLADR